MWVPSFWVRVVFISSRHLGLCFPSGRPSTWLLCLLGVPLPLRLCYLLDHIMAGFEVVSLTWLFFLLSVPGPFSWCYSMRWVPSPCCFSCYPLLPGCASCAWGVRPLLFIVVSCLLFSRWALALLFMAPRPFCLRSFFTVLTFRPVVPPGWSPLAFLLCAPGSHSLCLFVPCVCTALGHSSFLLPSSLAASSLGVFCPLLPFYRSWFSLPGSCFPFLFIVTPSGVPCRSSVWFLIFLSSLLALMASSSSVNSLPSSAGFSHPLVARRLGVPPSRHPSVHLLVGGWSSSMALLLHGLLLPPLHLAIAGSFSISLGLPLFCSVAVLCPVHFFGCRVVLLVSLPCCSLGFLALRLGYWGLRSVLPAVSMPCCFRLPLSFLQSFLLWSTSRHFDVCLP